MPAFSSNLFRDPSVDRVENSIRVLLLDIDRKGKKISDLLIFLCHYRQIIVKNKKLLFQVLFLLRSINPPQEDRKFLEEAIKSFQGSKFTK